MYLCLTGFLFNNFLNFIFMKKLKKAPEDVLRKIRGGNTSNPMGGLNDDTSNCTCYTKLSKGKSKTLPTNGET
jgi:hypothetical protein